MLIIPENYEAALGIRETEVAIKKVKDFFQQALAANLNLARVTAPLFLAPESGLNDNLNGVERPVSFGIKEQGDREVEIVHSLAKWKRFALKRYGFAHGEGLYTDMNAIRRDEDTDNIHSIFVDQWDWERVINKEERNTHTLKYIRLCRKQRIICLFNTITLRRSCHRILLLSQRRNWKTFIRIRQQRKENI